MSTTQDRKGGGGAGNQNHHDDVPQEATAGSQLVLHIKAKAKENLYSLPFSYMRFIRSLLHLLHISKL